MSASGDVYIHGWGYQPTGATSAATDSSIFGGQTFVDQTSNHSHTVFKEDDELTRLKDQIRGLEYDIDQLKVEKSNLESKLKHKEMELTFSEGDISNLRKVLEMMIKTVPFLINPEEFFEMFKKVKYGEQNSEIWSEFVEFQVNEQQAVIKKTLNKFLKD